LSWQEIVARSSEAIVHLEGLSVDGRDRMTGTGFFITSDGVLITNRHMAESVPDGSLVAYSIFGERLGSAKLEADTVGTVDLAVMKVAVNGGFLDTIVNYARAKIMSDGIMARLRDAVSFEKQKSFNQVSDGEILTKFVDLLRSRFKINAQRASDLFTALRQGAE
jgi:hypothetical protein